MDGHDGVERQRPALPPIAQLDFDKRKPERLDHRFPSVNSLSVSTAPMGSPNTVYSVPPPPYSYSNNTTSSQGGYISPPESTTRRSTREEDKPPAPRNSLPSIHEALGADKSLPFSATSQHAPTSTPSTAISTHFPEAPKGPSNPFSAPSFRDNPFSTQSHPIPDPRPKDSYATATSPRTTNPPNFHSGPLASVSSSFQRGEAPRSPHLEQSRQSHIYPPTSHPPSAAYGDSYSAPAPANYHDSRPPYPRMSEPSYEHTVKRHIDVHEAARDLNDIREIAGRSAEMSNNWSQRFHEGSRSVFYPNSLPSLGEIDDMVRHSQMMIESLSRVKEIVKQNNALSEHRAHFARPPLDDEYHRADEFGAGGFAGADAKKRRGKAAPPGRCHSCNRAETPEWRRGPDGARTLCNACGLHYAKLSRKHGVSKAAALTTSNLRPKNMDHLI